MMRTEEALAIVANPSDPPPSLDLAGLFAELASGRTEALDAIYDATARDIHGLALWRSGSAAVAHDVVQDVFVRLAHRAGDLGEVRSPRSLLLAMAHRACIDRHRRTRREVPLSEPVLLEAVEDAIERRLDGKRASALLAELPDAQREAIYLHDFAGLTFSEAAAVMGVPTFTAASRYRLGIRKLRNLMGVHVDE